MSVRHAIGLPNVGVFGDPAALVELGAAAEAAGWDGVFVNDHVLYSRPDWPVANPVVVLSAIAARTSRVRLGVLMTALPRRRVQVVARESASLDVFSGGRTVFGAALGSMDSEYAAFGENPSLTARAHQLDASLATLDALWSGHTVTLAPGHPVRMLPTPLQQPRIPVWCAARWPRRAGLRRAARWDGVVATFEGHGRSEPPVPPDLLAAAVAVIARERGSLGGFDVALEGSTTPGTAPDVVRPYVDAGLTWWIEALGWWRGGLTEAYDRISGGPPA